MKSERIRGNYSLLRYEEPAGTRRLVASYVLENAIAPDVYNALTGQSPSPWLVATNGTEDTIRLHAPGAPTPFDVAGSRPFDLVKYVARNTGNSAESAIVVTIAPSVRCTVVTISHSAIDPGDELAWQRFWCGRAFVELGDTLHSGGATARPMLMRS